MLFNKFFLSLLLLFIIGIFSFFYLQDSIPAKKGSNEKAVNITIDKGDNFWAVGQKLVQSQVITNKYYLAFYLWKNKMTNQIKAGEYSFSPHLSIAEVADLITSNPRKKTIEIKITFPEGWTSQQMAKRIKKNGLDGDEFLKLTQQTNYFYNKYHYDFLNEIPNGNSLEGFLFPDTYFFSQKTTAEDIIKKMLDNFNNKLNEGLRNDISKQNKSVYDIIIMASVLEKEVKSLEDKKKVSDIFWRRLKDEYPLQSCATLAYVLGENKKQFSYQDTQIKSPYNTYQNIGLPPGPINNPGMESILASIYPEKNSFYYFLSNPENGMTVFSHSLEEHNQNKVKNGL